MRTHSDTRLQYSRKEQVTLAAIIIIVFCIEFFNDFDSKSLRTKLLDTSIACISYSTQR